jgi:hypothetical protein
MNAARSIEPSGGRGGARLLKTFTARAIVATVLVVLVSVLVTGIVALPLSLKHGNDGGCRQLARNADLAASLLSTGP